jgi:hypothetical protein
VYRIGNASGRYREIFKQRGREARLCDMGRPTHISRLDVADLTVGINPAVSRVYMIPYHIPILEQCSGISCIRLGWRELLVSVAL